MDQMPEAIITADDPANERAAQALTEILGENHRRCHYENEYAKLLHDLLIGGYMVQETGFDPHADGGLGGAFLRHADAHNVMVDPMVRGHTGFPRGVQVRPVPQGMVQKPLSR